MQNCHSTWVLQVEKQKVLGNATRKQNQSHPAKAHACQPVLVRKKAKETHERSEVITLRNSKRTRTNPLFLEEVAQLVHHTVAAAMRGRRAAVRTTRRTGRALVAVLVLLHCVLGDAAHDRPTDCSDDAVIDLVTREAASRSAREGTGETALALLAGRTLLIIATVVC